MNKSSLTVPSLLGDLRLLVVLFVSFRLLLMMVYQPFFIDGVERGVSAGGDLYTYYGMAQLAAQVGAPYQGWWPEFPPVWPFLFNGVYQLLGANVNYTAFAMLLGLIMLGFDVGNLLLLRALAADLYGANTGIALAWVYALCLAPAVFLWWTFETLVIFTVLLALWLFAHLHGTRASVVIVFGTLTKFTPALLLAATWRFRQVKHALRHTLLAMGIFVLVYIPLFSQNAPMTWASLSAQFSKASYQTVWALIDGNLKTGSFGPLEDRLYPERAAIALGNPPRVPGWLRLGVAGLIGLFIYARTRRFDHKGFVAFATISLLIFFLQAQGWSPQWLAQIIPLVLLCFPTRNGVFAVVLLTTVAFAEYPFLFIRTGDTGGEISGALLLPYVILILARTALLIGLCIGLYRILRQEAVGQGM
ncbi:MAG: hypothetical protein HXY40_12190 [Chloroflexi bacterium]|nr:hypothetical protein [Chloroflexota bacterium]